MTLAVFTGAALVPATSQVTVKVPAEDNDCPNVGAVTRKGPEAAFIVTTISSLLVCGATGLLFRKVNVKLRSLATLDTLSQVVVNTPASTVLKSGKYLTGELTGENDLKTGPAGFVGKALELASV